METKNWFFPQCRIARGAALEIKVTIWEYKESLEENLLALMKIPHGLIISSITRYSSIQRHARLSVLWTRVLILTHHHRHCFAAAMLAIAHGRVDKAIWHNSSILSSRFQFSRENCIIRKTYTVAQFIAPLEWIDTNTHSEPCTY